MSLGEALGWTGAVLILPTLAMVGIGAFLIEDATVESKLQEKAGIGLMLGGFALALAVLIMWIIAIWTNVK